MSKSAEKERMREFMSLPLDMQKDILREQGIVSTLTHTNKQVAKSLAAYLKRVRATKVSKPVDLAVKVGDNGTSLRQQVFTMLDQGVAVSKISKQFGITYANAHYYKRAWKKLNG